MGVSLRRLPLLVQVGAAIFSESPTASFVLLPAVRDLLQGIDRPLQVWTLVPSSADSMGQIFADAPAFTLVLLPDGQTTLARGESPEIIAVLIPTAGDQIPPPSESPRITLILAPVNYPDSILLGPDEIKAKWNWSSEILMESVLDVQADWEWRSSIVGFVVTSPRKNPQRVPRGRGVEIN